MPRSAITQDKWLNRRHSWTDCSSALIIWVALIVMAGLAEMVSRAL